MENEKKQYRALTIDDGERELLFAMSHPDARDIPDEVKALIEKVKDAVETIVNASNCKRDFLAATAIFFVVSKSHRTLQANFIRILQYFFEWYAKNSADPRNIAAVEYAEKINEIDHYIPYI